MKEPWQLTRRELVPYAQIQPIPRVVIPAAATWSEADLAAHKIRCMREESQPPLVPQFPIGTWTLMDSAGLDGSGWLWHLEEVVLKDLLFPNGNPFDRATWDWFSDIRSMAVEKYVSWLEEGFEPPPLEVWQTPRGRLRVEDGHNRGAALVTFGRDRTLAWISPIYQIPEGRWEALTHCMAVAEAVRQGMPVPKAVLDEYPGLVWPPSVKL